MSVTIYHNPRCSKSRQTLSLIEEAGQQADIILYTGLKDEHSPEALIAAMAAHPILIERPIVVRGEKAVIGRPPEAVKTLL